MLHPQIARPTLLLRPEIVRRNIDRMAEKARQNGLVFRPHFKTHQSWEIGRWFREAGVECITVSSIEMAEYFASDGWDDILIAFPVNVREIERLNRLAARIKLCLILDHPDAVEALQRGMHHPVQVSVEIDCGDGRTGVPVSEVDAVIHLCRKITQTSQLKFAGLVTHAGHSYSELRLADPIPWYQRLISPFKYLREAFRDHFPGETLHISYGDTPSCSMLEELPGIDEIRPGNFVFFDLMQEYIGSCQLNDIAVVMAVPVVSVRESSVVVHGGGVHFAKDNLEEGLFSMAHARHFGWLVQPTEKGWLPLPQHYLKSISQEHGEVHFPPNPGFPLPKIGDTLFIVPVHSCMTADLMMRFHLWENGAVGTATPMMKAGFLNEFG